MKFFIARGDVRKKLLALHGQRQSSYAERERFAKRFRGKPMTQDGTFVGLNFPTKKNGEATCKPPFRWKKVRGPEGTHAMVAVPDRSREGKLVRAEMAEERYQSPSWMDIVDAIGMSWNTVFDGRFQIPDFNMWRNGDIVFCCDHRVEPKGCYRISDVEYEKRLACEKRGR